MKLSELRLSSTLHGWDPLRIVAQILALQTIHYILLAAFVPPLLAIFTEKAALRFEGGPAQVGMMLDWREIASRPTWDWDSWAQLVDLYTGWNTTGKSTPMWTPAESDAVANWTAGSLWLQVAFVNGSSVPEVIQPSMFQWNDTSESMAQTDISTPTPTAAPSQTLFQQEQQLEQWEWHRTHDVRRGWAISAAWMLTIFFDVQVLYFLIRKPTHVLDFVCTMHLLHLVITSLYAGSLPFSLYWWMVMSIHASLCILLAERWAIQREMRVGFSEHAVLEAQDAEAYELDTARRA